ncbi:MAG TPA: diguanylate cyclase [Silvibacterium sp.]|nr:diguanylate cyclase [Silvibacterium sp.]
MTLPLHSTPGILIASADAEATAQLKDALSEWRYPVQFVSDGVAGLKVLTGQTPPSIALIDAGLPMLSGIELAAEVKRRAKKRPAWTMLMSEQVDIATVASATDAGIDDLLLKPVDVFDLRVRLRVAERVQALASELDEKTDAVQFHASHDSLTGLWNRESLLNLLFPETDRVQRMRTPLALLLLDLDHFSSVNIDYGYEAGDKILQELANRFRRFLRSYDLIGRCGEDEFLIALPGCTSEQALAMAIRVKKTILQKPFAAGRDMLTLTASMGTAQSGGRSPLVVLREAERALAEAKRNGRNAILEFRKDGPGQPEAGPLQLEASGRRVLMPFPTER